MYRLRANTPNELIPSKTEATAMNFPLGKGHYPIFDRYPKYVVNYQLQERQRIEEEEAAIKKKRSNHPNGRMDGSEDGMDGVYAS